MYEVVPKNYKEIEPTVEIPLNRTVSTHGYCCICGNKKNLVSIPLKARLQCFSLIKIFLPRGNRVCNKHLLNKNIFEDDLKKIDVYSKTSYLTIEEISLFMTADLSSEKVIDKITSRRLSDTEIKSFTGYSYNNMDEICKMLTSMKKSVCRDVLQTLVIFLFKLRTGASNNLISNIFQIHREQSVSDFCSSVLRSFEKDILPSNFGVQSYFREDFINNHTSFYAKKLFGLSDQLALVFDGTYLRHQKSKNNTYQRKSYSGHKKTALCKPFTICTTNGFVVDLPGPFLATENDATIIKKVMSDSNGIISIMKPGDVCIVDRGFRDAVVFLEQQNQLF